MHSSLNRSKVAREMRTDLPLASAAEILLDQEKWVIVATRSMPAPPMSGQYEHKPEFVQPDTSYFATASTMAITTSSGPIHLKCLTRCSNHPGRPELA
ncbi:hypothetical protein MAUB1S_05800 [Mycolicibacterium aubagnense]